MNNQTNFEQSSENWNKVQLKEVIAILESGLRPKGGATEDSGDIPSLGGENIKIEGGVIYYPVKRIDLHFFKRLKKGRLEDEDVLINKDGANTGKVGLYENKYYKDAAINEHLFRMRGIPEKLNNTYFYYYLLSPYGQKQTAKNITGSAQPGLNTSFINRFQILIPCSVIEQSKIAEILSTIDEAIDKTDKLIEKYKRIKQGLMQDLFRYGIDENGNIRSEKTHKFINSPLGRIPVEWECKELRNYAFITKLAGFEFTNYFDYQTGGEIIALRALNIKNESLDLTDVQHISQKVSDKLPRSKIYADDILITYIGAYIGDILLIKENDKYHLAPNVAKIVAGKSINPQYLELFLRSEIVQRQMKNLTAVTATPSLTMTQIRNLFIYVPFDIDEQVRVVSVLTATNEVIANEEHYKQKLLAIKHGLMDDLLSGKVRVNHLIKK